MRVIDLRGIIKAPVISEKSTLASEVAHQVVFRVRKTASKLQIKCAVETLFQVEVASVNVLNVAGKQKRFGRFQGSRQNWKKAYVKLKDGFDIDFSAA